MRENPFMAWIEMTLGLALDDKGTRLIRAKPLDLDAAAERLTADAGLDMPKCRNELELALEISRPPGYGSRLQWRPTLLSRAPAQVHLRCRPRLHDP